MNFELFNFGAYGQYVWPAFIFTFFSCLYLYLNTFKKFKKQERIFLKEFKQLEDLSTDIKREKNIKRTLSGSII